MRVLIFGATGMVGQAVVRECLMDSAVGEVVTLGRSACGVVNPKLRDVVKADLFHYAADEAAFEAIDACFFCLGVSSAGMNEADYTRLTYTLTIAAAEALAARNPAMTFIYVSGMGTDGSEKGSS
ncbi:MAG: NAD(P)H-binding protein, partial [Acidobacteriota bacterium]